MKLLWCCMAVAVLLTTASAAVDVERTVAQVQNILQANQQLPRLSRDEIIQLLNDIRAEDAKSKSTSTEHAKEVTTKPYNSYENEINSTQEPDIQDNIVSDEKHHAVSVSAPTTVETTTKNEPSVMVVLPYTPRDGASLQELYTKPPRVERVPVSQVTPRSVTVKHEKIHETLKKNAQLANQKKQDLSAELQAFLDAHGLKGKPGQDNFLLPLDGFKPLPPARVIDGTVQLPENILLTYDLISPDLKTSADNSGSQSLSPNNFLYEPLRPEYPFELDTSSSEQDKVVLPLTMPERKKTQSNAPKPNFEPVDYDAIKVIPLNNGPNPLDDDKATLETDLNKRQAGVTVETETTKEATTTSTELKDAITNSPVVIDAAASDSGASIADLEESFGGAAPEQPGDSELPPPRKNGFYWMVDWNSFLEVGDGDTKVNIRFEPKLGDPQMFLPVNVP